ncbi:MAG TPA: MBL fold metallo-hydrolase [Candidatus Didemnitutus sp.]|jgi:7,8-dihydropterin-6-yl-methyl-4-(beta-D-ribofuranosyl)aminobenzene 5'-phosphate synthase
MQRIFRVLGLLAAMLAGSTVMRADQSQVQSLKITLLSTMLADGPTLGEWGFSALVEADGHRILFDTGAHDDIVLKNAQALHLDLSTVPDVVLSHSHSDHVGGLMTLRRAMQARAPGALAVAHVGEGMFYSRSEDGAPAESNPMIAIRPQYEATGAHFVSHPKPAEIYPGIWLTGPVPRKYPERNWSGSGTVRGPAGVVEDTIPEDMALVCVTAKGLVVITGCGHAGVINILDDVRGFLGPAPVHALIGGIHLFNATDATVAWTGEKLKSFGVENFLGAHCTGIETVYLLRPALGLDRAHAVVGAVGAGFSLERGLDPGNIVQ